MALIHLLQRFAALISARDAMAVVVLAAVFGTAVYARFCAPDGLRRHRFAFGAVGFGGLALLVAPSGWLSALALGGLLLAVVTAFALHTFAILQTGEDHTIEEPEAKWSAAAWIGAASILAAFFLITDLGGYAGSLMVWEPESQSGLIEASKNGVSLPRFVASRLLWGEGLVSTGHDSLVFGSGTYALWRLIGVSPITLRLMAVLLAAACLPAVYAVGKAIGGRHVATAAVVVIAVNPVLLFYGRYGVSLTATFFAVLLLLLLCLRLLDQTQEDWRRGLATAGAAYLATLGYATGRVVAVAVVTMTLLYGATQWRRLTDNRRRLFVVMTAVLAGIWLVQAAFGTSREFVTVRREHILVTDPRPEWVEELLDEHADPAHLTPRQRLTMAEKVVAKALSDLRKVLSFPFNRTTPPWEVLRGDPPEFSLAQGPVLLFALWGFVGSFAVWRSRWPVLLAATLAAAGLPLLLANRIDVHRLSLVSLPIVVWAALGLVAAGQVMRACGVSTAVRHVVGALLLVLVVVDNSTFLFYPSPPLRSFLASAVHSEIDAIDEPVRVGVTGDHRGEGEIALALLDRRRLGPDMQGELLQLKTVSALTDERGPDGATLVEIEGMLHDSTVILAPLDDFDNAIHALQGRGMQALKIEPEGFEMWRLDRVPEGRPPAKYADGRSHPLNPKPRRPRATADRSIRRRLPVIEAQVLEVYYGSTPPYFDVARIDEPIIAGEASFGFGIGMHAWTHMRFAVPQGAVAMEAIIGLSEAVSDCDQALVTFEVWGEGDHRIFDSGPVGAGMTPRQIRVLFDNASSIALVVTEAGNGRECDQVIWADPIFTLDR